MKDRYEDPQLLALAHGRECLLRIPSVCNSDPSTVVAAHSNSGKHGKGRGIKAEDCFTVWACSSCHSWLDQGKGTREERETAFRWGWERQVKQWQEIARNICQKPRHVNAARRVLQYIEERNLNA